MSPDTAMPSAVVPIPPGTVVLWGERPHRRHSSGYALTPAMRVTGDRVGVVDGNGEWHRPGYGDDGVTTVLYRAAEVFPHSGGHDDVPGPAKVYAVRANYDATGAAFVTTGCAEGLTGDGWVPLAPGSNSDVPGLGR